MNFENGYVPERLVIQMLLKHLGGTADDWQEVLLEDRSLPEIEREFSFKQSYGTPSYELAGVYYYIFRFAPEALGMGKALGIGSVDGSSFTCSASHAVNYERSGEIVVELEYSKLFNGRALMSPEAARKLSAQLVDAAAACETHAFDVAHWKVVPRDQLTNLSEIVISTGDLELDLLLAELDSGGTKKSARAKKTKAS